MWIKADDKLANHPKIRRAGQLLGGGDGHAITLGVFHWLLSYCNEYFTDGFIADEILASSPVCRRPLKVAKALIDCSVRPEGAGLLHKVPGGYEIHDYHDWNPTAEESAKLRQAKVFAGREGGLRSGQVRKQKGKQNGSRPEAAASSLLREIEANGQANAKQNEASASRLVEADAKQNRSSRARDPVQSNVHPPNPPHEGGDSDEQPYDPPPRRRMTRAERKWAEETRRKCWGRCPHDPPCPDYEHCLTTLVVERRERQRDAEHGPAP